MTDYSRPHLPHCCLHITQPKVRVVIVSSHTYGANSLRDRLPDLRFSTGVVVQLKSFERYSNYPMQSQRVCWLGLRRLSERITVQRS